MSPKQKGEIVRFVKKHQNKITLAIGDGANDVNMIQEAHIGIGLYGKEGMRAVQASDYALPEFKALWKLLFVHGRWSYIRNSEMILYFYYKNVIFALPQFYFCLQNAWSGQTFFDDFYITFYNMAFTALPVIARAIFDQDIYYKEYQGTLKNFRELKKYYHHLYYVG
jgi:magnesium-transporting ATPase (P-type)